MIDKIKAQLPNISEDCLKLNGLIPQNIENKPSRKVKVKTLAQGGTSDGVKINSQPETPDNLDQYFGKEYEKKQSKYGNCRTEFNGRTYASGAEAKRASELELLLKARQIFCLQYQVRFPVSRKIVYVADFVYLDEKLNSHIEDCKGFLTPVYKLKKKLFRERYGRDIEEI
jgi:hypothetical protein